jgi:hypothetical protein
MVLWSIAALALALIRPGHGPGDVLLLLVPLSCLGGMALDSLAEGLRRRGHWLNEGLYLAISAPLWAYLAINLATYSSRPGQYTWLNVLFLNVSVPTYLSLAVASLLLLLIMAVAIGLVQGIGPTLRGLGLSTILVLLVYTIATTWGVSQNRPADPRETLILEPTAREVRLLRDTLNRLSIEHQGDAQAIDLAVLRNDPALAWVLRDFQHAQFEEVSESAPLPSAVIVPRDLGKPQLDEGYIGQSFPLRRRWGTEQIGCRWNQIQLEAGQVPQLDCSSLVDWITYRRSQTGLTEEQIVLWLRQDLSSQRIGNPLLTQSLELP